MSTPSKSLVNTPVVKSADLHQSLSLPASFEFGEVRPLLDVATLHVPLPASPPPALGPLAAFVGSWVGGGFNTIFRPDNTKTPTVLAVPVVSDNILELNLTTEELTFSPSLGSVPNRGSNPQGDIFLNGVPYLQTIKDVTFPNQNPGIHAEPGLWMAVPNTAAPNEGPTLVRMGSIPHGATIQAQGTSAVFAGGPAIAPVGLTPFRTGLPNIPANQVRFPSQTAATAGTARIPQDLTTYIADGKITQAMLDDPNTLLRNQIKGQTIKSTTVISISTASTPQTTPAFGGGTANIAFLDGDPQVTAPNAQTLQMSAIFWIELVEHTLQVPAFKPGQPPLLLKPLLQTPGQLVPTFSVTPPSTLLAPRPITVTSVQIQYTQTVMLNFAGLTWPHVSVATLVPSVPITVPASVWA